jgi:hypothetical protein
MKLLQFIWLWFFLAFSAAGAQTFGSPNLTISAYKYLNIVLAAPTTTVVKSGAGILHTVCINTPAATGTIAIYDNTSATAPLIGTITAFASTNPCFTYDAAFTKGLTIVTSTAANNITVTYY